MEEKRMDKNKKDVENMVAKANVMFDIINSKLKNLGIVRAEDFDDSYNKNFFELNKKKLLSPKNQELIRLEDIVQGIHDEIMGKYKKEYLNKSDQIVNLEEELKSLKKKEFDVLTNTEIGETARQEKLMKIKDKRKDILKKIKTYKFNMTEIKNSIAPHIDRLKVILMYPKLKNVEPNFDLNDFEALDDYVANKKTENANKVMNNNRIQLDYPVVAPKLPILKDQKEITKDGTPIIYKDVNKAKAKYWYENRHYAEEYEPILINSKGYDRFYNGLPPVYTDLNTKGVKPKKYATLVNNKVVLVKRKGLFGAPVTPESFVQEMDKLKNDKEALLDQALSFLDQHALICNEIYKTYAILEQYNDKYRDRPIVVIPEPLQRNRIQEIRLKLISNAEVMKDKKKLECLKKLDGIDRNTSLNDKQKKELKVPIIKKTKEDIKFIDEQLEEGKKELDILNNLWKKYDKVCAKCRQCCDLYEKSCNKVERRPDYLVRLFELQRYQPTIINTRQAKNSMLKQYIGKAEKSLK